MAEEKLAQPETPELPVSPQEVQIEAPSFFDKLKIHKIKILAALLGFLVSVGAGFGAYKLGQRKVQPGPQPTPIVVATPTPDPTANWETFSSQCGFTIKYPDGWKIGGAPICGSLRAPNWQEEIPEPRGLSLRFSRWEKGTKTSVFSKGISTPLTINTLEDYIKSHGNDGEQVSEVKDKTYGELSGKEFILALEAEATSYTYFIFVRDDFIYTVDWNNKYIENYRNDINLMLSTFKFTSEEAVGEKVFCEEPRPEFCTMECIVNPPYICGSDGKSYCSTCQACANPNVDWYVIQDSPCKP